jgi:hypothetical protein
MTQIALETIFDSFLDRNEHSRILLRKHFFLQTLISCQVQNFETSMGLSTKYPKPSSSSCLFRQLPSRPRSTPPPQLPSLHLHALPPTTASLLAARSRNPSLDPFRPPPRCITLRSTPATQLRSAHAPPGIPPPAARHGIGDRGSRDTLFENGAPAVR